MRLALSTAVLFMVLAARPSWAAAGSQIDDKICLKCEDVVPDWIRAKHFDGKDPLPGKRKNQCKAACVFDSKPVRSVFVYCGSADEKGRRSSPPKNSKRVDGLGDCSYAERRDKDALVYFVDKDTPCTVIIHGDPENPETEAREIALGRDVAKALTPEVVERRRQVDAVVWEQDATGARAKAALAAWPKEAEAAQRLVRLAPGFPKLIDHKGKPGLPEGKQSVLLGYCPNRGSLLLLDSLQGPFPGAQSFHVSAAGTVPSCPEALVPPGGPQTRTIKVGDKTLSAVAFIVQVSKRRESGPHGQELMFVHIYLRDGTGRLVDSKVEKLDEDVGAFLQEVAMPHKKGRLVVRLMVNMGDVKCKGRDTFYRFLDITADGNKIVTNTINGPMPNCECPGC